MTVASTGQCLTRSTLPAVSRLEPAHKGQPSPGFVSLCKQNQGKKPCLRVSAQTEQQERQQQQQQNITRRIALPATASVLIAAAGVVVVRNIFTNLAGPEGKKATLKALSSEEESREGKVPCMHGVCRFNTRSIVASGGDCMAAALPLVGFLSGSASFAGTWLVDEVEASLERLHERSASGSVHSQGCCEVCHTLAEGAVLSSSNSQELRFCNLQHFWLQLVRRFSDHILGAGLSFR